MLSDTYIPYLLKCKKLSKHKINTTKPLCFSDQITLSVFNQCCDMICDFTVEKWVRSRKADTHVNTANVIISVSWRSFLQCPLAKEMKTNLWVHQLSFLSFTDNLIEHFIVIYLSKNGQLCLSGFVNKVISVTLDQGKKGKNMGSSLSSCIGQSSNFTSHTHTMCFNIYHLILHMFLFNGSHSLSYHSLIGTFQFSNVGLW